MFLNMNGFRIATLLNLTVVFMIVKKKLIQVIIHWHSEKMLLISIGLLVGRIKSYIKSCIRLLRDYPGFLLKNDY